jgi:hypothetical protein
MFSFMTVCLKYWENLTGDKYFVIGICCIFLLFEQTVIFKDLIILIISEFLLEHLFQYLSRSQ